MEADQFHSVSVDQWSWIMYLKDRGGVGKVETSASLHNSRMKESATHVYTMNPPLTAIRIWFGRLHSWSAEVSGVYSIQKRLLPHISIEFVICIFGEVLSFIIEQSYITRFCELV